MSRSSEDMSEGSPVLPDMDMDIDIHMAYLEALVDSESREREREDWWTRRSLGSWSVVSSSEENEFNDIRSLPDEYYPDKRPPVRVPSQILVDLKQGLKSEKYCDVEFQVGEDAQKVYAHKIILMLRSPVFENMFSDRWLKKENIGGPLSDFVVGENNLIIIKLPKINVRAFRAFLQCLYSDDVENGEQLTSDELIEAFNLGVMYNVQNVASKIQAKLRLKIPEEPVKVYEALALVEDSKELRDDALFRIKTNLRSLLEAENYLGNIDEKTDFYLDHPWSDTLWLDIVKDDEQFDFRVEEIDLWKALIKWSEINESKRQSLKNKILPWIRFPLMKQEDFLEHVVPTGLLADEDVDTLISYFQIWMQDQTGNACFPHPWKTQSRCKTYVNSVSELTAALRVALPCSIIQTGRGKVFNGNFTIDRNFITIQGAQGRNKKSKKTLLSAESLDGPIFRVYGSCCQISNFNVNSVHCMDCKTPLFEISGNNNTVRDIATKSHRKITTDIVGISVLKGEGHILENLSGHGSKEWAIVLESDTKGAILQNFSVSKLSLHGANHHVEAVICSNFIYVAEKLDHKFVNCTTGFLMASEYKDCVEGIKVLSPKEKQELLEKNNRNFFVSQFSNFR